jgi:hypothetical protein
MPKEMVMSATKVWALSLPVAGLLALAFGRAADSDTATSAAPARDDLIVHEWGTFSTFSGSNGKNLTFYPYDDDLPEFVHGYLSRPSKTGPKGGSISLETPVIYFYSDRALNAWVQVQFPKGTMTEWYPHAVRTDKKLSWKVINVTPRAELEYPTEDKKSRYYAARETDATPLRVALREGDNQKTEEEKFLFYRGVGSFDMPLSVRALGDGKFTAAWSGTAPKGDLILVQVQAGKIRYQPFCLDEEVKNGRRASVQVPDADSTEEKLSEELVKRLTEKGLYKKEAQAMVKTWRSAWFGEEGVRVLYILPEDLTNELLPLRVEPKPTSILRVLVGRHDVLTPEREKKIDALVAELIRPTPEQDDKQKAAWQELLKLGRYAGAAYWASEARLKH